MGLWGNKSNSVQALEVNVQEVAEALDEGTHTLVDVREPFEWDQAHIDGALLIPLEALMQRASEIPADKPVFTICHSGSRSLYAVELLAHAGHPGARSLAGGMLAWAHAGKPMVR